MQKIGLFVTCLADAMRPEAVLAALRLICAATGAAPLVPSEQTCCGQIAFSSGYDEQARAQLEKCAREFAECDVVALPSGSCCGMLKKHIGEMQELGGDADSPIARFGRKCMELSQFLQARNYAPPPHPAPQTIAFHDSCAGLRELGIQSAPRRLLQAAGHTITELPDSDCCGFGGRFSVQFGEVSAAMATRKCDAIIAAKPDAVTAGDLGCLLQIEGRLRRMGSDLPVRHWAEILAAALPPDEYSALARAA